MIKYVSTSLLCLVVQIFFAQNYTSRLFSGNDGLPDNYVYSVLQDEQGYLWVASGKGLCRFDGQEFVPYRLENAEENTIVYTGAIDKAKETWFGTFDGKIYKLDRRKNALQLYPKQINGSVHKILPSLYASRLYILSRGNGIFVLENNRLEKIKNSDNYELKDLVECDKKNLLVSTSEGLFCVNSSDATFNRVADFNGDFRQIQASTTPGVYYVSDEAQHLFKIQLKDTRAQILWQLSSKEIPDFQFFYAEESRQELYFTCKDEHFASYDIQNKGLKHFSSEHFQASATSLMIDKESTIWIGTVGRGLYAMYRSNLDYIQLHNEAVRCMVQDKEKNAYYGGNNGILVYNAAGTELAKITRLGQKELGKINALYIDEHDQLWIGTAENGLFVCDKNTFSPRRIEFSDIQQMGINAITADPIDNEIQVCTNLSGVFSYRNGKLIRHLSVENGLLHNNIYSAFKNKTGTIYYAMHNTGFNIWKEGKVQELEIHDRKLGTDYNCFAEDSSGTLYVGTNGSGICLLSDTQMKVFEKNSQFESGYCKALLFDKSQQLWTILGEELYKYYPRENVVKKIVLEAQDRQKPDLNSLYLNPEGDLFICTSKYVVVNRNIHGSANSTLPAKAYILSLRVNDSLAATTGSLQLSHGSYNLKIDFSALALKNSAQVQFRYMLEGRDAGWSELSRNRHVEFANLHEGDYIFKVKAYNSEGFEEALPAEFHIVIQPPFWKSLWFWIAVSLLLLLVFILAIRLRTASLTRAKQKLEQLVEEKTKELREEKRLVEENNRVIEEQNHEIKDSILYAKRIQDAILPDKKIITDRADRIFVFYQPRDIVSGDFYWLGEVNGIKVIVAADCTGHGVPGAFMSMIGNTLLNKIVIERKISKASEILKELDKEVRRALKQYTKEATKDGMDVALCCVDDANHTLAFCGALRPLLHVRKKQLTVYAPNKHSIGGFNYGEAREFTETLVHMEKNDMLYIFSDGYADQFGGESGKKMMMKNFKQLLVNISDEELYKQEDIVRNTYNNWKGSHDQIDDVLVIGLRM